MHPTGPNVILVIAHDLGRRLGCYEVPGLETPAIDRLAREGVVFTQAFAAAPLCSPSRGSIMTGAYPHVHGLMGLVNRGWDMPDRCTTLPQAFAQGGYDTLLFGFQHEKRDVARMGYHEHRAPQGPHRARGVSAELACFLRERAATPTERPFFAVMGTFEVHRPFKQEGYVPDDPARVSVPAYLPDTPETREDLADLHGLVAELDRAVGRVHAVLLETGLADNTLLIVTTDHGIAFPGAKSTLYDPGIETALVFWSPLLRERGRRCRALVSNVDLMPTLLDFAGLRVPATVQGHSFLPLLYGRDVSHRQRIFAEKTWHDAYDPKRCVREEGFKLIWNPKPGPRLVLPLDIAESITVRSAAMKPLLEETVPEWELYDLARDPLERNNLAGDPAYAQTLQRLQEELQTWMHDTHDPILAGDIPPPDPEAQAGKRRA